MGTLTETQRKNAAALESKLDVIQAWVDEQLIEGNRSVILNDIYAELGDAVSDIELDVFKLGWSACVKTGKITGIESARRYGWRKIGYVAEPSDGLLKDVLPQVQEVVDRLIIKGGETVTSIRIYEELGDVVKDIQQPSFSAAFSAAANSRHITGIVGLKRKGWTAIGSQDAIDAGVGPDGGEDFDEDRITIRISRNYRLYPQDKYNWALQQKTGEHTWLSKSYWPHLEDALRAVARGLLDKEIRSVAIRIDDIKDISVLIKQAEERIYYRLKEAAKGKDENKNGEAA